MRAPHWSTTLITLVIACAAPACVVQDSNQQRARGVEASPDDSTGVVEELERTGDPADVPDQNKELGTSDFINAQGTLDQLGEDPSAPERASDAFEGDIIVEPDPTPNLPSVAGSRATSRPWPGHIVHYKIESATNPERIKEAIAHFQARTSIRFVARTTQPAYVAFVSGTGCSSYVGRLGYRQPITLSAACNTGNVIHEIGHAVGLSHEHARSDRDSFVKILWKNVAKGKEHNFTRTLFTSVGKYDIGSIMQFGSSHFSGNGLPTMTKLDGSVIYAQRIGLSKSDIAGIAAIYAE